MRVLDYKKWEKGEKLSKSGRTVGGKIGEIKRTVGIFALWSSFEAFIFCFAEDDRTSIC